MIVLKPTTKQYNELKSRVPFVKDSQGNWIIGLGILEDESFSDIKPKLLELAEVDILPEPAERP